MINTSILVETKKEYTIQLVNILTPVIYEGLKSMYEDAINMGEGKDTLILFQQLLRRIPRWPKDLIQKETQRIRNQSKCVDWFDDLIKAVVKANIIILCNSMEGLNDSTKEYYENINVDDFIHKCYIESGRELFNSPYLLYHKLTPVDTKKNQRDCCNLIKESIKEAIRKILPTKQILNYYLKNNNVINNIDKNEGIKLIKKYSEEYLDNIINNKKQNKKQDEEQEQVKEEEQVKERNKKIKELGNIFNESKNDSDINNSSNISKEIQNGGDIFGNLSDDQDSLIINKKLEDLKHITETGKTTKTSEKNKNSIIKSNLNNNSTSIEINKFNKKYDEIHLSEKDTNDSVINIQKIEILSKTNNTSEKSNHNLEKNNYNSEKSTYSGKNNYNSEKNNYKSEKKNSEKLESHYSVHIENSNKYTRSNSDDNNINSESSIAYNDNNDNYEEIYSNKNQNKSNHFIQKKNKHFFKQYR